MSEYELFAALVDGGGLVVMLYLLVREQNAHEKTRERLWSFLERTKRHDEEGA